MTKQKESNIILKILLGKVPAYLVLLISFIIITGAIIFQDKNKEIPENISSSNNCSEPLTIFRSKGNKFTKPILFVDKNSEDPTLLSLESSVNEVFNKFKSNGVIRNASMYLRILDNGQYIDLSPDQKYMPGSMLKIVLLIYYLKESENKIGLLEKKIYYGEHNPILPEQVNAFKPLPEHNSYTIRQLLEYMIVQSDNDATFLLRQSINQKTYNQVFLDLGIASPENVELGTFTISCNEMARFFRVLYNASYISQSNSEYALQLLSKSRFEKGFRAHLNDSISLVHKFGERNTGDNRQLSECGIIYAQRPIVLCIMSDGANELLLPQVIQEASQKVYAYLNIPQK